MSRLGSLQSTSVDRESLAFRRGFINFDVHALFFSKDAVGIEVGMHERLAQVRVNTVNRRREFFRATPVEVKEQLADLAGELLQFQEIPDALEYRECLAQQASPAALQERTG